MDVATPTTEIEMYFGIVDEISRTSQALEQLNATLLTLLSFSVALVVLLILWFVFRRFL